MNDIITACLFWISDWGPKHTLLARLALHCGGYLDSCLYSLPRNKEEQLETNGKLQSKWSENK